MLHVTTQMAGGGGTPLLFKKTYSDGRDWGVWHFNGDMPVELRYPAPVTCYSPSHFTLWREAGLASPDLFFLSFARSVVVTAQTCCDGGNVWIP